MSLLTPATDTSELSVTYLKPLLEGQPTEGVYNQLPLSEVGSLKQEAIEKKSLFLGAKLLCGRVCPSVS